MRCRSTARMPPRLPAHCCRSFARAREPQRRATALHCAGMTVAALVRRFAAVALLVLAASAAPAQAVDEQIRSRVEQLRDTGILSVAGKSIAAKTLIPKLYEARAFTPTWRSAQQIEGLVEMIDQSWLEGL